jgi:hypothetical protein
LKRCGRVFVAACAGELSGNRVAIRPMRLAGDVSVLFVAVKMA